VYKINIKYFSNRKYGRKKTMLIAGLLFDLGVIITCAAFNLAMLIIGRIFLGIAVAFAEEILKQKPERQLIKLKTEENSCLNPLWQDMTCCHMWTCSALDEAWNTNV
jgi:MFS family permease